MKSKDLYEFTSDRPITQIEDDILGRSGFSEDLANAMASWHGNDSLVLALHGDWGSGKSSIKNMALSKLKELTEKKPNIIEFSPWEWAAQEKILESFFQEISISIGRTDKSKSSKKLAATFKKYGSYLNSGKLLVSGFSAALPVLFSIATFIGIGSNFSNQEWVKSTSITILASLGILAAVLKWGKDFLELFSENINEKAKNKEQNLSEIRQELTGLLQERESPMIIVIDDLDRLTSTQLRMIFQLIKANLELPNVVFLLLFQRDLVEEKMNDGSQKGRNYLEKIIQVPFDIPKIETSRLHNLLLNKLDKIIEQDKSVIAMFNSNRWGNLFYGSLGLYFDNLRNVYRYISTLSFHFNLLKGRNTFEVNPVDLMALECLRVFEPNVYKKISISKKILTESDYSNFNNKKEIVASLINEILENTSEEKKESLKKLIMQLFPTIEWAIGGPQYAGSYARTWLKEMRVCHSSNFDKYFQFSIPSGELSNSDLQDMLKLTNDSEKFSSFILSLKERNILKNALSQFEAFSDEIPLDNCSSYIKGLLDIGDQIDHKHIGFTIFSSNTHATRLVILTLNRINNLEDRGKLLLECFKASKGISIVEHILQVEENKRNKQDNDYILRDEEFDILKAEFVTKLDDMSENTPNDLISHEHLVSFLYRWKRWGNKKKVINWLQIQTQTIDGCLSVLSKFIQNSSSQGFNDYVIKNSKYIKLENIENFLDIMSIQNKISEIDETKLTNKEKETLEIFREAINNRENGIVEDW
ncbi:KAP family P-loop NTPase fold protein [Providencia sp. PROV076]|uniref:KAP family P-loop NTPase fold protein n=1 Tax=Providencia sp. PROV076 TaxID=2949798 RepID=UPI00234BA2E9|nr:P-loop NTPase fold protein [Providencia sp. PROV076]